MEVELIKRRIEEILHNDTPIVRQYISEIPKDTPYIDNCCKKNRTALHNGQRKLFNSLLCFLTKYAEDGDVCVYVGSSPGYNICGVAQLFPQLNFYLYDPKPSLCSYDSKGRKIPNIHIFTERFTQQDITKQMTYIVNGQSLTTTLKNINHKVLFFSDLRTTDKKNEVREKGVARDLNFQLELLFQLLPRAFSLKFRIPYITSAGTKTENFQYVDGFGLIQPFAKQQSNEIRLMNKSESIIKNNMKQLRDWSLVEHENRMFYINTVCREWGRYKTKDGVEQGDNCFDCALEEMICEEFLRKYPYQFHTGHPLLSKDNIEGDVVKMRNWINTINPKVSLVWNRPKIQENYPNIPKGEFPTAGFEQHPKSFHGSLPLQDRSIDLFLEITNPLDLIVDVLFNRGNTKFSRVYLLDIVGKHKELIEESITHKSMNIEKNYERLEFRGDRILSNCIAEYFFTNYDTQDISVLNGHLSAFTSGEIATELFSKKLGLRDIIKIHSDIDKEKALEDVFEAVLAAINIIFDTEFRRGIGMMVCYQIIDSILGEIDFDNFEHYIFPPKTRLKELFNEKIKDGWDFDKQYKCIRMGEKVGDKYVDAPFETYTVTIKPPQSTGLTIPDYQESGPKKRVEKNAAIAALEFLKNWGVTPTPRVRDLGLRIRH